MILSLATLAYIEIVGSGYQETAGQPTKEFG